MIVVELYGFRRANLHESSMLKERIERILSSMRCPPWVVVVDSIPIASDESPYLRIVGAPVDSEDLWHICERLEHLDMRTETYMLHKVTDKRDPALQTDPSLIDYLRTNYACDLRRGVIHPFPHKKTSS